MDYLWTPWRFQYLKSELGKDDCVFCKILEDSPAKDVEHFVLAHGPRSFLILNRFPYTAGHLMVVPDRHFVNGHPLKPPFPNGLHPPGAQ